VVEGLGLLRHRLLGRPDRPRQHDPRLVRAGQSTFANWDTALATLDRYDPGRVFFNSFLDTLLP
jgi:hypothetical protein